MKTYKDELIKSMNYLAEKPNTIFVGQQTAFAGNPMSTTILEVSKDKMIETPVFEEVQMGMSVGLGMTNMCVVSFYPRWDFVICAANQLINHLDKFKHMTDYDLFVYPCIFEETFCASALEALAAGLHVITTNFGALPETCAEWPVYVNYTKNLELLDRIIKAYTNENDVVLDIFMGSGSTAMSCLRTNRKYLGCESNKEYYEKIYERIKTQKTQKNYHGVLTFDV